MRLFRSFKYAAAGLVAAFSGQLNIWVHLLAAATVVAGGFYFKVSATEWCVLIITIALVVALELVNTALEHLTDIVSPGRDPRAAKVKDIAAAAVLFACIMAIIVAALIFVPKVK